MGFGLFLWSNQPVFLHNFFHSLFFTTLCNYHHALLINRKFLLLFVSFHLLSLMKLFYRLNGVAVLILLMFSLITEQPLLYAGLIFYTAFTIRSFQTLFSDRYDDLSPYYAVRHFGTHRISILVWVPILSSEVVSPCNRFAGSSLSLFITLGMTWHISAEPARHGSR